MAKQPIHPPAGSIKPPPPPAPPSRHATVEQGHSVGKSLPVAADNVNHPTHYTMHPSGIECITIVEWFNFNVGNAIKYLWRSGLKYPPDTIAYAGLLKATLSDLRKAEWYIRREIERLGGKE